MVLPVLRAREWYAPRQMGKRVDNDATQEVSASMLVPPKPPVYPKVPTGNDASMWMSAPVSADDFLSGPNKKKPTAPRSGRGALVAVIVLLLVATAGAGAWYAFLRERPKETTPAYASGSGSAAAVAASADAGVAVAAADAAVAAADAGAAPVPGALVADAVSGADPAVKHSTKKRAATKKTVKKKTATAPKKKKRR
jgi:hypothetical protein